MSDDHLYLFALLYSLVFTAVGVLLGMLLERRKVRQLQAKIHRLKRTVAHLQRRLDEQWFAVSLMTPRSARQPLEKTS